MLDFTLSLCLLLFKTDECFCRYNKDAEFSSKVLCLLLYLAPLDF